MKSKKKQRILALILSMVLMLSASISALAEGDVQTEASGTETTENQAAVQSLEQETVPETEVTTEEGGIDTQSAETSTEPVQENTEQEVTETPAEPEQGVTEETAETTDTTQSQAQSTEVQEESDAAEEIPVEEQPGETTEETVTEETVVSEAAELKQEFTDENGNVTQTVTAYVPEGAFQATADQISMEVSLLNTDDTNYIKGMMEELVPENNYLDGYVLYQIDFKVNGEITQPAKSITITMNGNDLAVEDTQKAHVFYYDSEDPEVEGDKDQLIEVTQKDQLLKSLEESGQSTENIEDYDYSEITVNEGNADSITVKGWASTIYGCYAEKEADLVFEQDVDGVKVRVTAEKGSLPDNAELTVTKIDSEKEIEKIVEAVAEQIADQNKTIQDMMAFDITFTADGKVVQPESTVKVEIENTGYESEEGLSVYHVDDDQKTATNMEAVTETVADVEFETTHFSTYVVINESDDKVNVTIEHYLTGSNGEEATPLFRTQTAEIPSGTEEGRMTDFTKEDGTEFQLDKVKIKYPGQTESQDVQGKDIMVTRDVTVECYYSPISGTYRNGTTFFDYDVYSAQSRKGSFDKGDYISIEAGGENYQGYYRNGGLYTNRNYFNLLYSFDEDETFIYDGNTCTWLGNGSYSYKVKGSGRNSGINSEENYPNGSRENNRISMGGSGSVSTYTAEDIYGENININDMAKRPIKAGIVTELTGNDFENVIFSVDEPGYFSADSKEGKRILDDYELEFQRNGNSYTLEKVYKGDECVEDDLSNFWPLDSNLGLDGYNGGSDDGREHNWYFGMRYDFEFSLGDYIGDMAYSFNGDDDLWVFLDGKPIIDLGGIHSGYPENNFTGSDYDYSRWVDQFPNEVDLWEVLLGKENYTQADKEALTDEQRSEKHRITVLFMERGGYGSNCMMNFVLPNVESSDPIITQEPKTKLAFDKKDIDTGAGVEGAVFGLYSTEKCQDTDLIETATSDANGNVSFNTSLKEGVYYLKETESPQDYLPSAEIYTVTVTSDGTSATAKIENSNGGQVTTIYNQQIENSLTYDKSVKVDDWDERTYNITLEASSIAQRVESAEPVEIVLVFDRSGSMKFRSNLQRAVYGNEDDLDPDTVYYYIRDNKAATVYRVWCEMSGGREDWKYIDDSDWDYENNKILGNAQALGLDSTQRQYYTTDDEYDRLHYLQLAANTFADELARMSPNSELALVTFTKEENGVPDSVNTDFALQPIGNNVETFKNTVNSLTTMGGTQPSLGLKQAEKILDSTSDSTKKQYVILLTDGCPADETYNSVENSVESLLDTERDRTLMTVAVGLNEDNTFLAEAKSYLEKWATVDEETGFKYAFSADNADTLPGIFQSILQAVTTQVPITEATIRDYIDPRFEVIEDSLPSGIDVKTDEAGRSYVEWTDQTIYPGTDSSPGWKITFKVRAKDNYIGGNSVTTNEAGSGITVGDTTLEFDNPTVNVKAELEINNYEVTIFKGDPVPIEDGLDSVRDSLFDVSAITSKYNNPADPLTENELTFAWYTNPELTEQVTADDLEKALSSPDEDITYYLQVTYNAGASTDESEENTTDSDGIVHIAGGDNGEVVAINSDKEHYPNTYYGVYKVTVITGEIQITKCLEEEATVNKTFDFTVTKDGETVATVSITVPAGKTSATLSDDDVAKLQKLARGSYTITESAADGYSVKEIASNGTNCKVNVEDNQITFTLGTFTENEKDKDTILNTEGKYDKGILGVASFTNEVTIPNWEIIKRSSSSDNLPLGGAEFTLTKKDGNVPSYYGKSSDNNEDKGKLIWYSDNSYQQEAELEKGTYILEETVAPSGYQKSDEKWEIEISENGALKHIYSNEKELEGTKITESGNQIVQFVYENDAVFSLPSAGGSGIFLYMIGGTLLLMAGSLMIYINRRKGVLRK